MRPIVETPNAPQVRKTARGKRTVARNAIKHGVLAREVVITGGEGKENARDFFDMIESLRKCYNPLGVVEEKLVETIATCWWRKARILRAENGEIRKRLDTASVDLALEARDRVNLDLLLTETDMHLFREGNHAEENNLTSMDRWSIMQNAGTRMRGHRCGLAYLEAVLQKGKSEITALGHISQPTLQKLLVTIGLHDCLFVVACLNACPPAEETQEQHQEQDSGSAGSKRDHSNRLKVIVSLIDDRLDRIKLFKKYAAEREQLEQDAEARALCLPPAAVADKLLRYEAHIDRQLYRAMDQLERLQRLRGGEAVPPPLNVNLGRRG